MRVSTIRRLHGQFSASVRSCGICGSFEINAAEEVNLFNLELGLLVLAKKNDKTPPVQHDLRAVALAKQKKIPCARVSVLHVRRRSRLPRLRLRLRGAPVATAPVATVSYVSHAGTPTLLRLFETTHSRAHYTCWYLSSPESAKSRHLDTHPPRLSLPRRGTPLPYTYPFILPTTMLPLAWNRIVTAVRQRFFRMSCENR